MCMVPAEAAEGASKRQEVRNIIFLIGDGMGLAYVSGAMVVSDEPLAIERAEVIGLSKTSSASHYVTDSAAAGTALATGTKTTNSFVGIDPDQKPRKSSLKYAQEAGMGTGVVCTSTVTHATPAAFVAHNKSRKDQPGIALDFVNDGPDVIIGGGRTHFDEREDGQVLTEDLRGKGYAVAENLEELRAVSSKPVAGLLSNGSIPRVAEGGPILAEMTAEALRLLSSNGDGFFLMVEGSQIDWGGHGNSWDYALSELLDFDAAVKVAMDFADKHPGTLVVITADHETGGLTLPAGDLEEKTIEVHWSTGGHSGEMVPVYAYGAGADAFSGIYENTDIFYRMLEQLGIEPDGLN